MTENVKDKPEQAPPDPGSPPADPAPPPTPDPPSADPPSDPPSDPPEPAGNPMHQREGESYEDFVNRLARDGHIDRRKGPRAADPAPPANKDEPAKPAPTPPAQRPPQPRPQNPHWAERKLFGRKKG